MATRKEVQINRAKVRAVLRLLKRKRCTNFRVVGIGQWQDTPRMPWKPRAA